MSLELNIEVLEPKQRYTSNDPIAGTVVVKVLQETEIDMLQIYCQCTSATNIHVGSQMFKSSHQHYKKEQNKPIKKSLPPGEYRYPFSFILPSSALLPETYSSGNVALNASRGSKTGTGKITWEVKASVPRFKLFDINFETTHPFWFIPTLPKPIYETNTEHSMPPIALRSNGRFKKKEPLPNIYFSVTLRESGVHQAPDTCGIRVKLFSDSERLLFLKYLRLSLEATTTFDLNLHKFKDVSLSNILGIAPHLPLGFDPVDLSMCISKEEFELPTMFYGSMQTPLISLDYALVVEAEIGMFNDPKFSKTRQVRVPVYVRSLQHADPEPLPQVEAIKGNYSAKPAADWKVSLPRAMSNTPTTAMLADISSTSSTTSSSYKVTAPSFTTPIAVPHELHLLARPSYATSDTNSPDTSLHDSTSSTSLYELWEPEYDDDIAALVFKRDTLRGQVIKF